MESSNPKVPFDFGHAITRPWHLPGGRNLLFRILIWGAALFLLIYAVFGRQFISAYGEFLQFAMVVEQTDDPEMVAEMLGKMSGFMGAAFLVGILAWFVSIAMETAMHKNAFRGADHGKLPLRFGKDELKVLVVQLIVFVLFFAIYFGGFLVFALLLGLATAGSGAAAIGGILAFLGFFLWIGGMIMVGVRLAPAASMSIRDNDIKIFEAWKLSKPYMWPMIGAYLVVIILGYIVIYAVMLFVIIAAFGNADFLTAFSGVSQEDPEALFAALGEQLQSPRVFIPLVIGTMIYVCVMMLWYLHLWGIGNYVTYLDSQD